ncbi:MAG TPA: glycosyltransferase [Candidatus Gemmiger avium]|nr:glycosyltransferase [Candidatus Gemmiger avium]
MNTAVLDKSQPGRDGTVACGASAPQDVSCPLVSIVVPVWGAEKYLPTFLDTVLAQTMPDWECILVDDGSPDNSGTICDEYAARDSRFVVIHKENGGVCAARNTGMRAARGRYLTFCDNDDKIHPRLLEWAAEAMKTVPGGFSAWRYTRDEENFITGEETGKWKIYQYDHSFFMQMVVGWTQWNHLYDRQVLEQLDVWFDEEWYKRPKRDSYEDKEFFERLVQKWQIEKPEIPVAVMPDVLYYWRRNEKSVSSILASQENKSVSNGSTCIEKVGYWSEIYDQMARHQELYPDSDHAWPWDLKIMRGTYLKQLAYALCCAKANGEKTPPLGRCKELTALLNSCKAEKTWSVYYLPFRLRQKWLVRFIYRLDESGNRNFGRFDWGFYYLLGGNWNR